MRACCTRSEALENCELSPVSKCRGRDAQPVVHAAHVRAPNARVHCLVVWIGIAAAFVIVIAVELSLVVESRRYHRSWSKLFAWELADWRANTIEVEIQGSGDVPVVVHCRSQGFALRTKDRRLLDVPTGLDMQAFFSGWLTTRRVVLPAGTRCGLYLSTLSSSGLRITPRSYLALHELGWTPFEHDKAFRWRWRAIALALALLITMVPLVALNPSWASLAVVALVLYAYGLFVEQAPDLWIVRWD
jgi:hypothetical protein